MKVIVITSKKGAQIQGRVWQMNCLPATADNIDELSKKISLSVKQAVAQIRENSLNFTPEDVNLNAFIAEFSAQLNKESDVNFFTLDVDVSDSEDKNTRINISLPEHLVLQIDEYTDAYTKETRSGFLRRIATEELARQRTEDGLKLGLWQTLFGEKVIGPVKHIIEQKVRYGQKHYPSIIERIAADSVFMSSLIDYTHENGFIINPVTANHYEIANSLTYALLGDTPPADMSFDEVYHRVFKAVQVMYATINSANLTPHCLELKDHSYDNDTLVENVMQFRQLSGKKLTLTTKDTSYLEIANQAMLGLTDFLSYHDGSVSGNKLLNLTQSIITTCLYYAQPNNADFIQAVNSLRMGVEPQDPAQRIDDFILNYFSQLTLGAKDQLSS